MSKILIVEDELIPASFLKKILLREGHEIVKMVSKGADAISATAKYLPEIILMDIMLKDNISGCDAAIQIHQEFPDIKIIFLTAYTEEQMLDMAVEAHAYAYLTKPYREKEIITTLKLASRSLEAKVTLDTLHVILINGYYFDKQTNRLYLNSEEVALGPTAIKLIELLCKTPYSSVSIEDIMRYVYAQSVSPQTLRSLIHRIREVSDKELIINVNKLGYKINAL